MLCGRRIWVDRDMTKRRKQLIIGIAIAVAIALVLIASGVVVYSVLRPVFQPRIALSAEEFTARMEEAGYAVEDHPVQPLVRFEEHLLVETDTFRVEFYVFSTEAYARAEFSGLRSLAEAQRGNSTTTGNISASNFNRFTQNSSGVYFVISRVENTIVWARTDSENRTDLNDLIRTLGYW